MTITEIVYKLKNDFPFLAEVIVYNNPLAVQDKIVQSYPANFENEEAMLDVIFDFAGRGNKKFVGFVLDVPFLDDNASQNLIVAWKQIKLEAVRSKRQK